MIYELLSGGELPFTSAKGTTCSDKQLTFTENFPSLAETLVRKILVKEPEKRISLKEIAQDAWLIESK
jgi:hypothetical protein